MSNSVNPLVGAAIIAVVVILIGFGLYKAFQPPQYSLDGHNGQPYGNHLPPAASRSGEAPAKLPVAPAGRS